MLRQGSLGRGRPTAPRACALLLPLVGCNPVYAPPIRAAAAGAPGRLAEGQTEVGISSTGASFPFEVVVPDVGYGLRDWLSLEGGGNFGARGWALGWAGARLSPVGHRDRPVHGTADIELGFGTGAGGEKDCSDRARDSGCDTDSKRWSDRFAYGAYQGLGLGLHIRRADLFLRFRLEESAATDIPLTVWSSAHVGVEGKVHSKVLFGAGVGLGWYSNRFDSESTIVSQLSMTLLL